MRAHFGDTCSILAAALVGGTLVTSCMSNEPCSDAESGFGVVAIPATLMDSVKSVTVNGTNCNVLTSIDACDAGGCEDGVGGVKVKHYYVRAGSEGTCTVVVTFSNGCRGTSVDLSFGPSDNCCASTCARSAYKQLPEECQPN